MLVLAPQHQSPRTTRMILRLASDNNPVRDHRRAQFESPEGSTQLLVDLRQCERSHGQASGARAFPVSASSRLPGTVLGKLLGQLA